MLVNNVKELIGNTPLLRCNNLEKLLNLNNKIYVKIEANNPGGSIKDRPVLSMIEYGLKQNLINNNTTLIEPTSGNTGVAMAMICASLNLKCIIVIPSTMSIERQKIIKQYGAKLVLTPGELGMLKAIEVAEELNKEIDNSIVLGQFINENNPKAHYENTAIEILNDLSEVDFLVSGIGTGGTITGIGRKLKEQLSNINVVGVEPLESPFLSEGIKGPHKIQGIGAGFKPDILDLDIIDKIIKVSSDDALIHSKLLAKHEGLLVGISSGAALKAAIELSKSFKNKSIVVILPDTGERYISTSLFD